MYFKPLVVATIAMASLMFSPTSGVACPFCTALGPTLADQREQATVAALGEVVAVNTDRCSLRVHRYVRGALAGQSDVLELSDAELIEPKFVHDRLRPGGLVLLFGEPDSATTATPTNSAVNAAQPAELRWRCIPVTEVSYLYFAKSPDKRTPAVERLKYFARFLEHAEPLIAEDAYFEFGHAPFDQVSQVADQVNSADLQRWLTDPRTPPERKGLYGLMLGFAGSPEAKTANAQFLKAIVQQPADDFRAGFDGILGGYLLADGDAALNTLKDRFLNNPQAAVGDVRHVLSALRFYREYGRDIAPDALGAAITPLMDQPAYAAIVLADLARWKYWAALPKVLQMLDAATTTPAVRAVSIGYLLMCPEPDAVAAIDRLRSGNPTEVADVERRLFLLGGGR